MTNNAAPEEIDLVTLYNIWSIVSGTHRNTMAKMSSVQLPDIMPEHNESLGDETVWWVATSAGGRCTYH